MKSFATLALAGLAAAQNITDRCGVSVNQDTSVLTPDVKPIADGLLQINSTTGALYDSIVAFDGSAASVQAVLTGAQTTLDTVTSVDNTVKGLTPITDANAFNALNLVQYVSDLACTVNFTVDAFIAQKAGVVAACQGPTALSQLNALLAGSTSLINDVVNVINDGDGFGLKGLAQTLSQPILDALNTGIAAFADQTSLPAGCAASSSTTTQTSTSTIVTGTTTVTTTATTTNTVTFGSGYGSSSLSKGPYGNSTASYGASKTTYGYPASSQPAKPTSYGASSISSYVKPSSSGAASYSAGVPAGSSPAASHPAASSSYAASSSHPAASSSYAASSSHPAASSSAVKPSTTYPAGTVPYTGAASSIVAGGFSAVVAVFAAALML